MPTSKGLTDAQIKNAKPRPKAYKLGDRDRLYLLVGTSGSKRWYWAYRLGERDLTVPLGVYPAVGLAEARKRRQDAASELAKGVQPQPAKDQPAPAPVVLVQSQTAAQSTAPATLWAVADEW